MGPKSELWARANYARLLRKTRRVADAEEQEKKIRDYLVYHSITWSQSEYRRMLEDRDDVQSTKYTLDHPVVRRSLDWTRKGVFVSRIEPARRTHTETGLTEEGPKVHDLGHLGQVPPGPKQRPGKRR